MKIIRKQLLAIAILLCSYIFTLAQGEYVIEVGDTLHSRIMVDHTDGAIDLYFAAPNVDSIPKNKRRNHFLLQQHRIESSGEISRKPSRLLVDESIKTRTGNIINLDALSKKKEATENSLQSFIKENDFTKTDAYKVPYDFKHLFIKGSALGGLKPPYSVVSKHISLGDNPDSGSSKNETEYGEISKTEHWQRHSQFFSASRDIKNVLGIFGKKVRKDKSRKFNELKDYNFVLFSEDGKVIHTQQVTFERSYLPNQSGYIFSKDGSVQGYYVGLTEAGGIGYYKKANENWSAGNQMVVLLDMNGQLISNDVYEIPYKFGSISQQSLKTVSVVQSGTDEYSVTFSIPSLTKEKVKAGLMSFTKSGSEITRKDIFNYDQVEISKIKFVSDESRLDNMVYNDAIPLKDGRLTLLGTADGNHLVTTTIGKTNEIESHKVHNLQQPFRDEFRNKLTTEKLSSGNILATILVANNYKAFPQYAIIDVESGDVDVLHTKSERVVGGRAIRFEDRVVFYGVNAKDKTKVNVRVAEIK